MEKVKSYSNHLLFSLTLSSALFPAAPAMGQAYSSVYPAPGTAKSNVYNITKTLNNKLQTVGVVEGQTADPLSSFPNYMDWRLVQTNFDGAVVHQRIFQTPLDDRAFETVRTTLGDMMVVGYTGQGYTARDREELNIQPDYENASPFLVRLTANGVSVFQANYEMGGLDDHAYSVVRENNDSYLVLGRSFRSQSSKYVITFMNVDGAGNVLSADLLHDGFNANLSPRKMIRTNDGGFLIAAIREQESTPIIHSPDPVSSTILGSEILLVKLDASRNFVFQTLVRPADGKLIGVKDMVEDNDGTVAFVGTSDVGDYIMTINTAGVITQSRQFSVASTDMQWEPKSILRISNGFVVSGTADGPGVPRVVVSPALALIEAKRHLFGQDINSMENTANNVQYLAGRTDQDALVAKWLLTQATPLCSVQTETVTMAVFPIEQKQLGMVKEAIPPARIPRSFMSSPAAIRVDNCLLPAAKMASTEAAAPAAEAAVSVSPNPAQDQLQLFVPGEEDAAYTLHDLQGRLLASGTLRPGSQVLPVADLARGVYVLRVHNTQFNSTHRISLQH